MDIKNRTVNGIGWSFVDNVFNQGLRFLVSLVLARIISPHDYGLLGISLIFVSVFENIVDGGFSSALIQKKEPTKQDYGTVFIINLSVSLALYCIVFLSSSSIARFFNNGPQISSIIRIVSLILVIDAFMLVPKVRLTKAMNFKLQTMISLLSSIMAGSVGITMALCGLGVWALVGQQLSRHCCNTCCLLIATRRNQYGGFSVDSFHSLFSFGSKILLSDLINSSYNQLYRVVIGKCYSPVTLGQFTRASQFSDLFSVTLSRIIQKVSFPALSAIQDERERLLQAFRMLIKYTAFVDFLCMFSLAAVARPMVIVLIGNQWLEAIPYLQILCFNMIFIPLHGINIDVIKVKGRSDIILRLEIVKKCLLSVPLLAGVFLGIYWMLLVNVAVEVVCYLINSYYSCKLVGFSVSRQIGDVVPSLLIAALAFSVLFALSFLELNELLLFPLQLVVGLVTIVVISELLKFEVYMNLKQIIYCHFVHKK